MLDKRYDVIVVGAGHAGCEAAYAASRLGIRTLLLTMNIDTVAMASCNPAIGGLGKGHLVYEIDALGGIMPIAADQNAIHCKMLNESKGAAVQGLRVQIDKWRYSNWMRNFIETRPSLDVMMGLATRLLSEPTGNGHRITGVELESGVQLTTKCVILTTGTFLDGTIHTGHNSFPGGRAGERSAEGMIQSLNELGIETSRLKTGTPARLDKRTIDWSCLEAQHGDDQPRYFHHATTAHSLAQVPCYITHTNAHAHDIIRANIERSAMYGGKISSVGPRYCPSIEDKIVRFPDRDEHHVFLEPEGLDSTEIYANGLSSSLPPDVQIAFLRTMRGLTNVHLTRFAYAIEYGYVPPHQIASTLESLTVSGLYMAGQINGTTGYEEAAMLGLIAGANAALTLKEKEPLIFARDEGYIGVLIDDLRTKEHREPYRMLTSRCEHRLLLRQDNAALRLNEKAIAAGLITEERAQTVRSFTHSIQTEILRLQNTLIRKSKVPAEQTEKYGLDKMTKGVTHYSFLSRPAMSYDDLIAVVPDITPLPTDIAEQVLMTIRYAPYIERAAEFANKLRTLDAKRIPTALDYTLINGLRHEAIQKLNHQKPETLGQATRIAGVNPTDIQQILIYLRTNEIA